MILNQLFYIKELSFNFFFWIFVVEHSIFNNVFKLTSTFAFQSRTAILNSISARAPTVSVNRMNFLPICTKSHTTHLNRIDNGIFSFATI